MQPFYVLAFYPTEFTTYILDLNIFFTLFVSLLAMWGLKEKKWWLFVVALAVASFAPLDYAVDGIILMLIFYLCRNKPVWGVSLFAIDYLTVLFTTSADDSLALMIGGHRVGFEIFTLLAAPFIFIKTSSHLRISKWVFYSFYPLHLLAIFIVRMALHI